ncbi:MAG: general secretion pathway protein GspK [Puniceicoccales bacterium]|nr:general secretion pathway protein GspK [Puniceicoccales bacterium]
MRTIKKPKQASVLLLVLGTIFVLSFLVTSFLDHVEEEVLYRDQQQAPVDLELEWQSYGDLVRAVLGEVKKWDKGLFSPEQFWGNPLSYAQFPKRKDGLEVEIEIQDETGKLPYLTGPTGQTGAGQGGEAVQTAQAQSSPANQMYRSWQASWIAQQHIKDWNAERKMQEIWQSILAGKPVPLVKKSGEFEAKQEKISLKNLDTLRSVDIFSNIFFHEKGWGNEAWVRFKPLLTPITIGPININTADGSLRGLIASKLSLDPQELEEFFQQKDTFHMGNVERFFRNVPAFQKQFPLGNFANVTGTIGCNCKVLKVAIRLKRGEQELAKSFWIDADKLLD